MRFHALLAARERLLMWSRKAGFFPLLLCRVVLGWEFLVSGWLKLHDKQGTAQFFTDLGIPFPEFNAALVTHSELTCGALLLVGLLSRLAAIPLIVTMVVALLTAKRDNIHGLSDLFFQIDFAYICMFLVIVILGPSRVSLDHLLARRLDRKLERDRRPRAGHTPQLAT